MQKLKGFQRNVSLCNRHVLLKEMFNGTHFIHNLVFTKRVQMIPTKTALGVMDSPESKNLLQCACIPFYSYPVILGSCLPKFSPSYTFPSTNYNYAFHLVIDYVM